MYSCTLIVLATLRAAVGNFRCTRSLFANEIQQSLWGIVLEGKFTDASMKQVQPKIDGRGTAADD